MCPRGVIWFGAAVKGLLLNLVTNLVTKWSEWGDLNSRPPAPEAGALPGCATLRWLKSLVYRRPANTRQESKGRGSWRALLRERDAGRRASAYHIYGEHLPPASPDVDGGRLSKRRADWGVAKR